MRASPSPDPPSQSDATTLLRRMGRGDEEAQERAYALIGAELRRLAEGAMRRQEPGHTLQPTALVHEAWLKLAGGAGATWQDRQHFLAVAARSMRSVLVDHARRLRTVKRGEGRERLALDAALGAYQQNGVDLLELDDALGKLRGQEPRQCEIVELRFFGGMDLAGIAERLGISRSTVDREWRLARLWLAEELGAA